MTKKKIQAEDIKYAAQGKWADLVFPSFGIEVQWKKKTPCPACGGRDRFWYDDKNGNGDYYCQQCGPGDGLSLIEKCCTRFTFPQVISEVASVLGLDNSSSITDEDRDRWRKERELRAKEQLERERKRQEQIARKAEGIFRNAYLGETSLYLKEKQVNKDQKIKIDHHGNVLIPAVDENGKIWNLQTIEPDGTKYFIKGDTNDSGEWETGGGRMGGLFFMIGEVQPDLYDRHIICIAEGYATGMSIHMAETHPVAIAFVANNLPKVGAVLQQKYPNALFVYCADDDSAKENTGLKYAQEAQAITGGIIVLPDFSKIKESVA